ncbi:hypothetical protein LUZ60_015850 [Juncus effusus]|nr:hypothetical protein LUZ60_015850 [Juncus effusus]
MTIHPTIGGGSCSKDVADVSENCKESIKKDPAPKKPPSKECCAAVTKCDIECVCDNMRQKMGTVSMKKVEYVVEKCGRPLEKDSKCITYEPSPPNRKL